MVQVGCCFIVLLDPAKSHCYAISHKMIIIFQNLIGGYPTNFRTENFAEIQTSGYRKWSWNCLTAKKLIAAIGFARKILEHDDVTKWKHFPRYWPFVRGIHQSPVKSPHKGQCMRHCGSMKHYMEKHQVIKLPRQIIWKKANRHQDISATWIRIFFI